MSLAEEIATRLSVLQPTRLEVLDESEAHRGHAGFREGGQSHFRIRMASPAMAGLTRLQRHRLVHDTLGDIRPRIHALALELTEN
ncbi:MAG: BolA family protein [Paracoccus sp. (in: a-proteobacteria)]|nr:BolA family protein [Paracoccus sp. (in: a-proteobacteria)]